MIQSYKDLIVWQKAMQMTEMVYSMVKKLPKEETYALSDQMRRAAVSIPSNIAEGYGRNSKKEYIQFLSIAKGSGYELETQMILTIRIGYVTEQEILPIMNLLTEIGKIINSMISKLKTNPKSLTPNPTPTPAP